MKSLFSWKLFNRSSVLCLLVLFLIVGGICSADQSVRVACVGDSITYGATITARTDNCYPTQLGWRLCKGYDVRNFGVNGATLLRQGNIPYWKTDAYQKALAFEPQIVLIKLGTNDSKMVNWQHKGAFEKDYVDLIMSFKSLDSRPRIILLLPVPAWTAGDTIDGGRIEREVIPRIRKVARQTGCEMIELHAAFQGRKDWMDADLVHPNSFGAEAIANITHEFLITPRKKDFSFSQFLKDKGIEAEKGEFRGYDELRFKLANRQARIVQPVRPAKGLPWIWRARFFGHEPQTDLALLERGFHVAYIDVANLYGSAEAVKIWDGFYDFLRQAGFSSKPVLEGMSRGGLIIYNWAAQNPDKVAAIYADAPVCDIKSWPGGKGTGKGSAADWQRCLKVYGITEATAVDFTGNPIDQLSPLAKAGIPLLHVVGQVDHVVPVAENTDIIEKRYQKLGGPIEVIRKEGVDHHPHSLKNPTPIINFLLKATGRRINRAVIPVPSAEHRGGPAGWGGGTWWGQHRQINQLAAQNPDIEIVFLGDSITQSWTGSGPNRLSKSQGGRAFDKLCGSRKGISMGISGDRTEHLLWRVQNGCLDPLNPKVIVVMIGVNNLGGHRNDGNEIAEGVQTLIALLQKTKPDAKIVLHGCFPTGQPGTWRRKQTEIIHQQIASLGIDRQVYYRDLRGLFLKEDGSINFETMRSDRVHITGRGYQVWADALTPLLNEL